MAVVRRRGDRLRDCAAVGTAGTGTRVLMSTCIKSSNGIGGAGGGAKGCWAALEWAAEEKESECGIGT